MLLDKILIHTGKIGSRKESYYNSENKGRSVLKALSWRVLGTLDTILVSWLVTGSTGIAFSIGFIEVSTKIVLYYTHERIWNTIPWGK